MIQTVTLAKLRLSPINVRTADAATLGLEPLAADIAARGVLQNLLVTPAAKPRGIFEVFDGGRRLRALQLLAEAGSIDAATFEVPVRVLKADEATLSETSLAANFHQLKLNPAEECKAFQHFLGADGDIDAVAKRFGQTRRFIEGRLRLASLAEPIFDALAAGEITLDVAKAYATTESHARQLSVWETYRHSNTVADTIRRVIAQHSLDANSAIARLVGEDAYVAAGGAVDRDLFADDADKWTNAEIAEGLADAMLKAEAERLTVELGLGWIRPIRTPYAISHAHNLYHVSLERPPLDEPTADRLAQLREREAELSSAIQHNGFSDAQIEVFITEINQVSDQIDTIENRAPVLPEGLRPHVGAFL
ncbi:MAG: chromosome partitioning protein ParB, partial [Stutzerimonas stutzeri]